MAQVLFYIIIMSGVIATCTVGRFILLNTAWNEIEKYLKDLFRKW